MIQCQLGRYILEKEAKDMYSATDVDNINRQSDRKFPRSSIRLKLLKIIFQMLQFPFLQTTLNIGSLTWL
mgnify:CR=1 FL=1